MKSKMRSKSRRSEVFKAVTSDIAIRPAHDAPFRLLVRPVTTTNVHDVQLSKLFEDEIFKYLKNAKLSSPISAILVLPGIMDNSIVKRPRDYNSYKKSDNSFSVGVNISFSLWQELSILERLSVLAENINEYINKIKTNYLCDVDREFLIGIVDKAYIDLIRRNLN